MGLEVLVIVVLVLLLPSFEVVVFNVGETNELLLGNLPVVVCGESPFKAPRASDDADFLIFS